METELTPQAVRERATAAHASINEVMMYAGLPNSTFWRWDTGKTKALHPVTVQKISESLTWFEAKRKAS